MTLPRDLAWQNIELMYHSSIAHQFARYALGVNYKLLPQEVIHQAKRCLLDALGCAIGAYEAPGRLICESVTQELGGTEEATIFCSGLRTSASNATLVNSFLVRFLDLNDIGGGGHNSDSIPAILAISERDKAGGRDLLTSIVISYELGARFSESAGLRGAVAGIGWPSDIRGGLSMPPALGKLMGLNEEQIANAIGICACHSLPLGILDTDKEENSMSKNLRFGSVAYDAIMACLLAKKGFTGPIRVIEGENGLNQTVLRNNMDFQILLDFSGWQILNTGFKTLCLNGSTIGHVLATLAIVKEHNLKPADIAKVRIKTTLHESHHTTVAPKKYPRNAENADHSAYWANAIAIKERNVTPEAFTPDNYTDPIILDLIEKITVEADPNAPKGVFWWGASEITTKDGRFFQKLTEKLHGFGGDPLTDRELEEKFRSMATKYMPDKQIKRLIDTIWNVEKLDDIGKLAKLMVFQR